MAQLPQKIYKENLPKPDEFSPIPEGNYNVIVSKTEYTTKESGRESIDLSLKVLDGPYANRYLNLSIVMALPPGEDEEANKRKETCLNISQKTLHQLLSLSGLSAIEDTDELLNRMFTVKVGITPARDGYDARNDVKRIMEYKGDVAPVSASRPQVSTPSYSQSPAPSQKSQIKPATNPWANVAQPGADKPARSW